MDNVEMAIQKVCASKVYTSAEFKREKDNFQSLCKNLERAETKKWLNETLETLMKVMYASMENRYFLLDSIQGEICLSRANAINANGQNSIDLFQLRNKFYQKIYFSIQR